MQRKKGMLARVKTFYVQDGAYDEDELVFDEKTGKYMCRSEARRDSRVSTVKSSDYIRIGKNVVRRRSK